jgi:hypothetical protein
VSSCAYHHTFVKFQIDSDQVSGKLKHDISSISSCSNSPKWLISWYLGHICKCQEWNLRVQMEKSKQELQHWTDTKTECRASGNSFTTRYTLLTSYVFSWCEPSTNCFIVVLYVPMKSWLLDRVICKQNMSQQKCHNIQRRHSDRSYRKSSRRNFYICWRRIAGKCVYNFLQDFGKRKHSLYEHPVEFWDEMRWDIENFALMHKILPE